MNIQYVHTDPEATSLSDLLFCANAGTDLPPNAAHAQATAEPAPAEPSATEAAAAPAPKLWSRQPHNPDTPLPRRKKARRRTTLSGAGEPCSFEEGSRRLRAPEALRRKLCLSLSGFGSQPARLAELEAIVRTRNPSAPPLPSSSSSS